MSDQPITGKPVRESISEYSEIALPNDANPLGSLLGGRVMHLVDMAGSLSAMRHARPSRPAPRMTTCASSPRDPRSASSMARVRSGAHRASLATSQRKRRSRHDAGGARSERSSAAAYRSGTRRMATGSEKLRTDACRWAAARARATHIAVVLGSSARIAPL